MYIKKPADFIGQFDRSSMLVKNFDELDVVLLDAHMQWSLSVDL